MQVESCHNVSCVLVTLSRAKGLPEMTQRNHSFSRSILLTAFSLVTAGAMLPASAVDNSSATSKVSAAQPGGNPVKTAALSEERQLRMMGEAIKRLRRAAGDLAAECTQPVEMTGEIDIIGTDVIPIMPATAEGFGNQYIPPRPKYVNLHMSQLAAIIPILEDDLNTLTIPDPEKDFATPLMAEMKNALGDVKKSYATLQTLTAKVGDYDATAIVNQCRAIHTSSSAIDSGRKKLLHEDKKIEKENK